MELKGSLFPLSVLFCQDLSVAHLKAELQQKLAQAPGFFHLAPVVISVENIDEIPDNLKEIYQTIWEMKQKDLIDMDADRSAYICQSSSSNRYMKNPNNNKLTSMYMYCWNKGLKTACYYLRTQSGADAVKFNVDVNILKEINNKGKNETIECTDDICTVCSA